MSAVLKGNWNFPTTIWAGPGRIAELEAACKRAGISRPLIVTDQGLAASSMVRAAATALADAPVFGGVQGNPTAAHVEAGLAAYRAGRHDGVVALGGGRRAGLYYTPINYSLKAEESAHILKD